MPIDIGSISALRGSLQSAVQIAKALASLRDGALIQEKVIELQQAILAAQSSALAAQTEQFALQARASELEEQISRMRIGGPRKNGTNLYRYPKEHSRTYRTPMGKVQNPLIGFVQAASRTG